MTSNYLEILQGKSDRFLISRLKRISIVSIVREHDCIHIILEVLLQSAHPARDVKIRHEEESNLLRAYHVGQITKLENVYH